MATNQNHEVIIKTKGEIENLEKDQARIHHEMTNQEDEKEVIEEDILFLADKHESFEEKGKRNEQSKKEVQDKIKKMEDILFNLKKEVNSTQKEIKDSTAVRESMARKASVATNEVR